MTGAEDVRDLLGLYCQHLDDGRTAELAALFCEDAQLTVMGKVMRGRAAIQAWFEGMAGTPALMVHLTANSVVDVSVADGRATIRSNWSTLRLGPISKVWSVFAVGTYVDEVVRTNDGWSFLTRVDSVLGDFTLQETVAAYLGAD
jgi:hypothetical protein